MIKRAVLDFLEALGPELRRQALFAFESEERRNWHYIPRARKGVLLKYMSEPQRRAAKALLQAALSERGYSRVEDMMWLETVLAEIEGERQTYDPLNYAFTAFGDPASQTRGDGASTAIISP